MFAIVIDQPNQLVHITVGGLLSPDEAAAYVTRIRAEFVQKIGMRPYVMLIDTRACTLQSQDVVETFRTHIQSFPKASRIALVNGDSLVRMQLRRVLTRDYAQFFDTVEAGRAWLLDRAAPPMPVQQVA